MASELTNDEGFRITAERISGTVAAYLYLPKHPANAGCVARTVQLRTLLDYEGPEIILDLDQGGSVIGIEILI